MITLLSVEKKIRACLMFWRTFIFVFDGNLVAALQFAPEDALHHQHQLVVCDVFIMDGDAPYVVAQLGFDDELPAQVQLAVHGAVWPLLLPPLRRQKNQETALNESFVSLSSSTAFTNLASNDRKKWQAYVHKTTPRLF